MMSTFWKNKTVLITGVSSGIGLAFAEEVLQAGAKVAGLDVHKERLEEATKSLKGISEEVLSYCGDVSKQEDVAQFVNQAVERFGGVDILLNNAGITHIAPFSKTAEEDVERLMKINFMGSVYGTYAAYPHIKKSSGSVGVISSVAGFAPLLYRTAYAASKHAVQGYFESLQAEWKDEGIHVLIACPSFVVTALQDQQQEYFQTADEGALSPAEVARELALGFERKKELLVIGKTAKKAFFAKRLFPGFYRDKMVQKMKKSQDE